MKRHARSGFTLVELLVVITIIGMLMALLLPAVNSARESGRRADCLNQITQLSKATINYESRGQGLPGYINRVNGNNATWVVMLFPFIERNDVWKKYSSGTPAAADKPFMELMICKSDPPESQTAPFLSYVANCGIPGDAEKNANGVFFNRIPGVSPSISMSLDPGLFPDGTTNTLMYSENIQADKWDSATDATTAEQRTGFMWHTSSTNITDDRKINNNKTSTTFSNNFARPSSYHPGGVNVTSCGGDGRWLREDIDYKVYQQIMTPDGLKASTPNMTATYILNDADWK